MSLSDYRSKASASGDDARRTASNSLGLTNYVTSWTGTQYAPAINKAKLIQLYVGPLVTDLSLITEWDNWTTQQVNGIIDLGKSHKYWLSPDSLDFTIQIKNKFVDAGIDTVINQFNSNLNNSKTESALDKINSGIEFANAANKILRKNEDDFQGSTYIPKYANIKAWEGTEPITYTFPSITFKFGQYGRYNSLEEVVLPIMALVCSFLPEKDEQYKDSSRWIGPIPTLPATLVSVLKSLLKSGNDAAQNIIGSFKDADFGSLFGSNNSDSSSNSDSSDNSKSKNSKSKNSEEGSNTDNSLLSKLGGGIDSALDAAINFKDAIYSAFDAANEDLLMKEKNKLAYFQVSNAIMGPFYIQNLTPTFDFKNVDQNGYPTKGSIKFDGVTTPMLATRDHLDIFGLTHENGPYKKSEYK